MSWSFHWRALPAPVRAALLAALTVLGFALLFPFLSPFFAALLLAACLERPVAFLSRRTLPRWLAAALCTALLALLLLGTAALLLWRGWEELTALAGHLPALAAGLARLDRWAEVLLLRLVTAAPIPLQEPIRLAFEQLKLQAVDLGGQASAALVAWLVKLCTDLPRLLLALGTTILATALTSAQWPALRRCAGRLLPAGWNKRLALAGRALRTALSGWLRAQGLLLAATFTLVTVGLSLLGLDAPLLAAALISLVDLLPILGAGAVLLPWSAGAFLWGKPALALGLLALYALLAAVRGVLEPRLVGKSAGLPPLAALAAMYAGFSAFGPAGMLLVPMGAVMAKALWDGGFFPRAGT